jgi:hypothetical protein
VSDQPERQTPITDAAVSEVLGRADRLNADEWQQKFGELANRMREIEHDLTETRDGHSQTLELLRMVSEQRDRFSEALDYIRDNAMTMTKEAIAAVATHGTGGAE